MITTQRQLPFGPEELVPFTEELFDCEEEKAARLLWSILESRSPRKSEWSQVFSESSEGANYRTIDRLLPKLEANKALMRLYDPDSPFVLVDPTEMERSQAKSTEYVGRLSDGETLGYWMVLFAQPYRGREVPFHFGLYSEKTIGEEASSRNIEWHKMLLEIRDLVGKKTPLVFDREFSAQRWLDALCQSGCTWVVRLNKGSGARFTDQEAEEVPLCVDKGQKREVEGVYYRGRTKVNVAGVWHEERKEPLWVMGNLAPERLIEIYGQRMKIEQTFKDSKSLLGIEKAMNKKRGQLQKTLAMVLILMVGEKARDDEAYGPKAEKGGLQRV